ncbi:fibrous sheath-interacting protein 1 isoform X2 [Stegostoma tigrinum]|nr:fibrous sheath-interacting protein 1 isoform X2 [Stegostoma tigrinum]
MIMDIVRGQLDEISRPASGSRTRPGSRVASGPPPDRRRLSVQSSGAMVVLTPEPILPQDRSDSLDNHINSMDSTANSSFERLDSEHETFNEQDGVNSLDTDSVDARTSNESQLPPEEHLDSIIIREMHISDKSEILFTSADCEVDSENHLSTAGQTKPLKEESDHNKQADLDHKGEDAQLEEAIVNMKKLDKILVMKQEKERQVKKQGKELRKKLWEELEEKSEKESQKKASSRNTNIGNSVAENSEGLVVCPEVAENTKKFLALTPTGNGADMEVTPIFHTQLPLEEYERDNKERDQDYQDSSERVKLTSETKLPSEINSKSVHYKDQRNQMFPQNRIKVKDFVKKNIELAKEAKNPVLLTDDEKKRLTDLLMDVEADSSNNEDTSVPWALSVAEREGYTPEPMVQQHLAEIDAKLQVFNLDDDFPRTTSSLSSIQTQNYQGTVSSQAEIGPGEEVLVQLRDEREHHLRMEAIEQQLKSLETAFSESSAGGVPYISKDQLASVLDECIRCQSLGRISGNEDLDSESVASSSPRPQLLTVYNSPRLSESVLSQLLADAYNSGLSPAPSRAERDGKISAADLESEDPGYYRNKAMTSLSRMAGKELAVLGPEDDKLEREVGEWMPSNNGESYMTMALEIKQAKKPAFLDDPCLYEFTEKELSTDDNGPTIPKLLHRDDENVADPVVEQK